MKRLTDPSFRYVPAASTNLKVTFARVKREQREHSDAQAAAAGKVQQIKKIAK